MIKRFSIGAFLVVMLGLGGYYFYTPDTLNVGAELPSAPALFETSLAAPITATADSFTITSNSVRGGGSLSGYNCFTIDEGSAQAEFVCGTASGTAVTNVTRGISPSDGTSAIASLQFAHRRGASVKITDFPIIQLLRNQNNGEATFENVLRYAGTVVPSGASDLADVGYVLSVVNGGTVNFDALVVAGTAGETLATSTLVYFKSSDQRWWKVDTDDTATFQGVALGLTRGAGTAGVAVTNGGILLKGLQTGLSALTAGGTYYASSSAGNFNTATSVLPIGVAKSTTELYFDPVMLGVPRLAFDNAFTGNNSFSGTTTFNGPIVGATKIDVFTSSSTWTKPTNAKYVEVIVIGGGGGGAGGSTNSTDSAGGAGGQGGGLSSYKFNASSLSSTVAVTVGAGGTGGAGAPAGGGAGGSNGTDGGSSSFGSYLIATGGDQGDGGLSASTGGSGEGLGNIANGTAGGSGVNDSSGNAGTATTNMQPTGGGSGGGVSSGSTGRAGSAGGARTTIAVLSGGTAGAANSGVGGNGSAFSIIDGIGGTGGGGGGGDDGDNANGGAGGSGAYPGGGGGGGGSAGSTSFAGGRGGDGANGIVIVITY